MEPNANADANTSAAGQTQPERKEGEELDPSKKDLQAKEREIIDLKVRPPNRPPKYLSPRSTPGALDGLTNRHPTSYVK